MVTFMHAEGFFQDPTYKCVPTMMYTIAEASTYLIASCMPALRPIKRHVCGDYSFIKAIGNLLPGNCAGKRNNSSFGRRSSDKVVQLKVIHKGLPQTPEDHKRLTTYVENDGFTRLNDKHGFV
jgi:hypothetical protein